MEYKVITDNDFLGFCAIVQDGGLQVKIVQEIDLKGNWQKAVVNWSGCGDRTAEEAYSYSILLQEAAYRARYRNLLLEGE